MNEDPSETRSVPSPWVGTVWNCRFNKAGNASDLPDLGGGRRTLWALAQGYGARTLADRDDDLRLVSGFLSF
ncbi:hypothetical protein [Streptomyces sp. NPDC059802]|uniref:hypothetical protein n=1 Tax=Streptomyces sp. NPDC059802 TaxID=3346952 RepID=UPI0036686591